MKLTTQRLKKLIKEELEGLEESAGQMVYVIVENAIDDYMLEGSAYMSQGAAAARVEELNNSNENPMSTYEVVEVKIMD